LLTKRLLGAAVAIVVIACGQAPSVGLLTIVNASKSPASVHWQEAGLLGKSGTEPVAACETYVRGFGPSDVELTVTTPSATSTFRLRAPEGSQTTLVLRIESDGSVRETSPPRTSAIPCT